MLKPVRKEIREHYQRVADLGCCVTSSNICIIHHCFGGSMLPKYGVKSQSDRGLSDWLVIPLNPLLHTSGSSAIHVIGAQAWEKLFGTQMDHLAWVNKRLPYDIFEKVDSEFTDAVSLKADHSGMLHQ